MASNTDLAVGKKERLDKLAQQIVEHPTKPFSTETYEFKEFDRLARLGHTADCAGNRSGAGCTCGTSDAVSFAMMLTI